jgi:hypothetical protein
MAEKMYLYRRPDHALVNAPEKLPNGATRFVKVAVSVFQGIEFAIRGTCLKEPTLIEALRVLRKIDAASHDVPKLQARYVILKQSERKLIEMAIAKFDWSRFCNDNGMDVWLMWDAFLEGVDPESEVYSKTWIEYDAMKPPAEYVEWKAQHEVELAAYNNAVAKAEAEALAKNAPPASEATGAAEAGKPQDNSGEAVETVEAVPVTEHTAPEEGAETEKADAPSE